MKGYVVSSLKLQDQINDSRRNKLETLQVFSGLLCSLKVARVHNCIFDGLEIISGFGPHHHFIADGIIQCNARAQPDTTGAVHRLGSSALTSASLVGTGSIVLKFSDQIDARTDHPV